MLQTCVQDWMVLFLPLIETSHADEPKRLNRT